MGREEAERLTELWSQPNVFGCVRSYIPHLRADFLASAEQSSPSCPPIGVRSSGCINGLSKNKWWG